jgi:hypothetical protein
LAKANSTTKSVATEVAVPKAPTRKATGTKAAATKAAGPNAPRKTRARASARVQAAQESNIDEAKTAEGTFTTLLTIILHSSANSESTDFEALRVLTELGRRRLEARDPGFFPEGSGRAVTPDCPRIPRGGDETVERFDEVAYEADYVLSIFGDVFAD